MLGIKKNDQVKVICGRDQGKTGRVLSVDDVKSRLLVEHVMMLKHHLRPNPQKNIKGGIMEREGWINRSNVMLVCPSCGPIRFRQQVLADGKKVRACRKCGNTLDQ
jgi:large subunit ribosomal protein L24